MPAITRLGDMSSGHSGFAPRADDSASGDVFVNGKPVHRVGDHWPIHCVGPSCHDGVASAGSGTVFVNGKAVIRIGDPISCGDTVAQGSPNVFVG